MNKPEYRLLKSLLPAFFLSAFLSLSAADVPSSSDMQMEETVLLSSLPFAGLFTGFLPPPGHKTRIAMASEKEIAKAFEEKTVSIAVTTRLPENAKGWNYRLFAYSGRVLAVNGENTISSVSAQEAEVLHKMISLYWKDAVKGGKPARIIYYVSTEKEPVKHVPVTDHSHEHGKSADSGKSKKQKKREPERPMVIRAANDSAVFKFLFMDPDGYAEFPLSRFQEDRVKLLAVDGILPTAANIQSGKYPLASAVYLVWNQNLTSSGKALLEFVTARTFAVRLLKAGYLPAQAK